MKLDQIKFKWRGKDFDFTPGKVNYSFHENGYGKTSLLDAIRYGLTGALPKDDVRGCYVELTESSSGMQLYRERGSTTICKFGGINGKKISEKAMNMELEELSGVSHENMKLISSSDIFSRMKPDEFLSLLLQYIPEKLTYEQIISYIDGFTGEMDDYLILYLPDGESFGIQAIDNCAAALQESRRNLKATVTQNKQHIAGLTLTDKQPRSLEDIESELVDLQVRSRMINESDNRLREYEMLSAKRKKQDESIKKYEEWLENHKVDKPDPQLLRAYKMEKAEKEKLSKDKIAEQARGKAMIDSMKNTLDKLNSQVCPISKKLVCTTDKTSVREEVEAYIKQSETTYERYTKEIEELSLRAKELEKLIEQHIENEKQFNLRLRYENELKIMKESLVTVPDKPVKTHATEIKTREAELKAEKQAAIDRITIKKLESINEQTEKEILIYNALVEAFADKGSVKKGILEYYVREFERSCNEQTRFAPGYKVYFKLEDGVKVFAKTPANSEPVYYMGLSSGEKIMVTLLVIDMLNQLTGLKMAFIDNVEQLDRNALENLHDILTSNEFLSEYDHVFVCGVNNQDVLEVFNEPAATRI